MEPVALPTIPDQVYRPDTGALAFTFDDFVSPHDEKCGLTWSYTATFSNGTALPAELIKLQSSSRQFTVEGEVLGTEKMEIKIVGSSSDEET